jgi:signal transduction histidine kinase
MQGTDDKIASIDLSLKPIKNDSGQVVLLIFEGRDITERKAAEEALQQSEKQLRHLSTKLLKAQESERKRIAQELHDSIGQSLSAIKFSVESALNWIGDEDTCRLHPAFGALQAVVPMVQQTVEETRRIMTDLRPSILDDLGIVATLGWFIREFQKVYPNTHVEKRIEADDDEVPEALKIVIYRIVQEAFHNISKYSKAEYVDLCLSKSTRGIELFIEDNGIGFDIAEALAMKSPKSGLGIASMRERTELSGGVFNIQSTKGEGTTIHAQWSV